MKQGGILSWFAGHHVASNLLMAFVFVAGVISLQSTTIEVFPEIEGDMVTVQVPYRGAAPAEVEEGVCMRVEEAIASLEGIKRIRSTASEGVGSVTAELEEDADKRKVLDDIKAAVDRIETFPKETEKPVVSESVNRRGVIDVVLSGDVPEKTLKALAERTRDELTAYDQISQVDISGVRRGEISIEVSEGALRRHGLTFDQVANAVRLSSLDLPGGAIKTAGGEIVLRTKGQKYSGREFEQVVVMTKPDGTLLRLGDISEVRDDFEDSELASRFDRNPAALVKVYRVGSQGALEVADLVKKYVSEKRDMLPAGVTMDVFQDRSEILKSRLSLLLRNGRMGLILVFVCLAMFLDLRLAFWTTLAIPFSFIGAFIMLPQLDVSIHMISLFAFIIVLGIVVDDAIVVGESIYEYRQKGMSPLAAAIRGVREMAVPVIFAVLTTVAAFLPLALVKGRMGEVMYAIPVVVISVLMISLMECLLILPSHLTGAARKGPPGIIARFQARVRAGLDAMVHGPYRRLLERAIVYRYVTVAVGIAVSLMALGFVRGGHIKFTFMPKVDSDNMVAALTMPRGTPFEETVAIVKRLEESAEQVRQEFDKDRPEGSSSVIEHISTTIGQQPRTNRRHTGGGLSSASSHLAEVNVELLGSEERGIPSNTIVNRWREIAGEVPGAVSLTFSATLFSAGNAIEVELAHQKLDVLLASVDKLKKTVAEYPGTADITDSFLPGKRELKLALTPEGRTLGLTLSDLARQVRQGFYGEEVQRIQRNREDVRVMVRYPEKRRRSLADIEGMRIRLPSGAEIPFSTVARVELGRGYAEIRRSDRRRVVSVIGDVNEAKGNANEINQDLMSKVLPPMMRDTQGLAYSFEGAERQRMESMKSLGLNFIVALFAIYALLAIPFRSYTQPLIVMSAIPFGIVGAVLGHVVMGFDLSLLSMMGIVALSGVVVNDSLVMIDLINRERAKGGRLDETIRNSGLRRFRPIMLTTVTTFFGLAPMLLEQSVQAKFLTPMAVSLGFGVVFATSITLLIVPALYAILEDIKVFFPRLYRSVRSLPASGSAIAERRVEGRDESSASTDEELDDGAPA